MIAFISSARSFTAAASACRRARSVTTANRHGWRLVFDGAVIAASIRRSSTARSIGRSAKVRTLRRVRSQARYASPSAKGGGGSSDAVESVMAIVRGYHRAMHLVLDGHDDVFDAAAALEELARGRGVAVTRV